MYWLIFTFYYTDRKGIYFLLYPASGIDYEYTEHFAVWKLCRMFDI